jgi:outer membrane protein assembly factor BamA
MLSRILTSILLFLLPVPAFCQQDSLPGSNPAGGMDVKDWLAQNRWIKARPESDRFLFVIPVIGVNPSAGFIYGGGLTYTYKSQKNGKRFSMLSSNASYSTKRLVNLNVKSNLFVLGERLFLNGDWRCFVITEDTYGLGSAVKDTTQSVRYNFVRFHETASWKIFPGFFAGIGIHYDHHFNIQDNTPDTGRNISYQYQYSTGHGFDPKQYVTTGFSFNLLYDDRDNQVDAYKGYYGNINYRVNETAFGSSKNSTMLLTEFRAFYPLDGEKDRHILAFWLYGNFVTSGNVPYLMLPALGYDQRQKTGRGYAFGRFRGEDMVYAESEYRFLISSRTGILGGVIFSNLTSTSDNENKIKLLNYVQPAYGTGLRVLLDKISRTRLQLDVAMGQNRVVFYFGIRETF